MTSMQNMWFYISFWVLISELACCCLSILCCCCCCCCYCCYKKSKKLPNTKFYYSNWSLRGRNKINKNNILKTNTEVEESNKYATIRSNEIGRNNTETSFVSNQPRPQECGIPDQGTNTNSVNNNNNFLARNQSIVYDYVFNSAHPNLNGNNRQY